ncbi:transposase [Geothermobacter hydrogeniphilus]|uniref:Transposase IS200-like domain-containing protein n=1 Tax=Geothermobacter hydrogeniphilus TaxID=1969733 RepID=A0A1X0YBP6_9BACT|nr:transposase [Geothermobacter hydrogeniphilus]ORJ62519.1 hypothetical protein B5V00_04340 [Geothermobacter hydrogeniphilus]
MSRFRKLTHAIWHCQYHIVWVPKYRFRILEDELAQEVRACIRIFSGQSRSARRILKKHPKLRKKRYWGNHFWAPGYCVDTVGLDAEMVRRYVRYQEQREKAIEQQQLKF